MEVLEELALEIHCCDDPEEKAELERTYRICQEFSYCLSEGIIEAEEGEDGGPVFYRSIH